MPTAAAGHGRTLAAAAVAEGYDTIIAAGGDGTLNEVLNGLADAPGGLERARLGVLPLGTVNVFARELGLPLDLDGAWRVLEAGREARIDLPEVVFGEGPGAERRCFAQLAGAGLDARAIELVNWGEKKVLGPLAYVLAGFKALTEEQPPITVLTGMGEEHGELILIGNGRFYGGTLQLFPEASLCDGLLDVTVFPRVNWQTLVRSGWGWLNDALHAGAGCRTFQAASFTLTAARPVSLQLDGDAVGRLPARFSVRPQALRVLVP
jgi:YegS/Rv2252/BmrU family lipid kinase